MNGGIRIMNAILRYKFSKSVIANPLVHPKIGVVPISDDHMFILDDDISSLYPAFQKIGVFLAPLPLRVVIGEEAT